MLKVSDNRRFLVHSDGKPFFWLADTAWELLHLVNFEGAAHYLEVRARQKFNVIQAMVVSGFHDLKTPGVIGEVPVLDQDLAKPNEKFFRHLDRVVDKAASLGLVMALLPAWGDKVNRNTGGTGPVALTPTIALALGSFLGARYRGKPVVWVLGGDTAVESEQHLAVHRAMAKGLREKDPGSLLTFHAMHHCGSSQFVHDEPWLDFNMLQSGHSARNLPNYFRIAADYARTPVKPCLDAEACYEDHPVDWNIDNGFFDAYDVRKTAYWSVFAGACGHTYGCHSVWQFIEANRPQHFAGARTLWRDGIELPGAWQMQHLRALIESRPYLSRIPDQTVIASQPGKGSGRIQATRDATGSYAFVYSAAIDPFRIDLTRLSGKSVKAQWFDPRSGQYSAIGEFPRSANQEFTPPPYGPDWVLVLDGVE